MAWAISSLPVPDSPRIEHCRVRARHLDDLLAHLPHRAAVAENVREVVPLAELVVQPHVFVDQALPIGGDELVHLQRLRQHRRHDAVELHRAVVVAIGGERELDLQHALALARLLDRHADVGDLAGLGPVRTRLARQRRFTARARYHDGAATVEDLVCERRGQRRVRLGARMPIDAWRRRRRASSSLGSEMTLRPVPW